MSHNLTPNMRRRNLLGFPVDTYGRAWTLLLDCGTEGCAGHRAVPMVELATRHPSLLLGEALLKMRCSGCGKQPARAALYKRDPVHGGPVLERLR